MYLVTNREIDIKNEPEMKFGTLTMTRIGLCAANDTVLCGGMETGESTPASHSQQRREWTTPGL